eukprot:COSAG02_NODE_51348_length_314_cov_1.362791_1_plen_50_part_01
MGVWSNYELLSGSDEALRMALQLCHAAGNDCADWPKDVQEFAEIMPPFVG